MAKKGHRIIVALKCEACKSQNYITQRNKLNTKDKLALQKFCNKCKKITKHKETDKLD
jgi:large subunit ribosomal protein L33